MGIPGGFLLMKIEGVPVPEPRPTFVRKTGAVIPDRRLVAWKWVVRRAVRAELLRLGVGEAAPRGGPMAIGMEFILPRPKSHWTRSGGLRKGAPRDHVSKPDLDNLWKPIPDAIGSFDGTVPLIALDDSQFNEVLPGCGKRYVEHGEAPGVILGIRHDTVLD